MRMLLFNYVSDPSGASDLTVQLNLSGVAVGASGSGGPPSQVWVKYLQASSVSQKGNFTWANQVIYHLSYFRLCLLINCHFYRHSVTPLLRTVV